MGAFGAVQVPAEAVELDQQRMAASADDDGHDLQEVLQNCQTRTNPNTVVVRTNGLGQNLPNACYREWL